MTSVPTSFSSSLASSPSAHKRQSKTIDNRVLLFYATLLPYKFTTFDMKNINSNKKPLAAAFVQRVMPIGRKEKEKEERGGIE